MSHVVCKEMIKFDWDDDTRIFLRIMDGIQKRCAEKPLPSIVSIFFSGDYNHNFFCRTFGRCKTYLPSKKVLFQLFDLNFEPFQVYDTQIDVIYQYNQEIIQHIINNLNPVLLLKTGIIYHQWQQQKSEEISSITSKNGVNPIYKYFIKNNIIQSLMHHHCDISSGSFFQTMHRDCPEWINYYFDSTSIDLPARINKLCRLFSIIGCTRSGWLCKGLH